jgi:hypothetical protein
VGANASEAWELIDEIAQSAAPAASNSLIPEDTFVYADPREQDRPCFSFFVVEVFPLAGTEMPVNRDRNVETSRTAKGILTNW